MSIFDSILYVIYTLAIYVESSAQTQLSYCWKMQVHKSGSVGRSIDLSRMTNYDELRRELARLFNIEGQLEDPQRSYWQLVFVDTDGDILLVGDDPWE